MTVFARHCNCEQCPCRAQLARDNLSRLCSPCQRHELPTAAPDLPDEFWQHAIMQAARNTRDMGRVSRAYRHHPTRRQPLQQKALASWIGLSQVQVCRIETGKSYVRDIDRLIKWAKALRMPNWYAWFELPTNPTPESSTSKTPPTFEISEPEAEVVDMKRRTALTLPLVAGSAALNGHTAHTEVWERLSHALQDPRYLDHKSIEHMQRGTLEFFRREEFIAARLLSPELRKYVSRVAKALAGGLPSSAHRPLLSIVGEALALYGWLAFDLGNHGQARSAWDKAEAAARDAVDGPLLACALGYRSYLAESEGDLRAARELVVAGQAHASAPSSATTRSWLAAREAEIAGLMGDSSGTVRAIDRATTAYDYARPEHERSWTGFFTLSRLGSMAVTAYMHVDHPDLTITADAVVRSLHPTEAKIKAVVLANVATAAIKTRDFDRGAAFAEEALEVTLSQEATLGAARLRQLRTIIASQRRAVPVLADLDARLALHL